MKILIKNISEICACATRENYIRLNTDGIRSPIINGNSILIENGKIKKIGIDIDEPADKIIDAENCLVTPGFVDSHTHLVFGGTREDEFEQRAMGMGYKEIAMAGGGILSTVKKTRQADFDTLYENASIWVDRLIKNGITSLEIKSGYGLNTETELKQLRVIKKLKESYPINIKATFLGAHEIPLEYRDNRRLYIDKLKNEMIPAVSKEGLADYIDIFCEKGVYTFDETMEILKEGLKYSLKPRIHADEMESSGGSTAAALLKAVSVDHMNVPIIKDLKVLSENKTVITLLPATNFILNINSSPPIKEMRKLNNIIAISTDFNPGSSPVTSIMLTASIGMLRYGLLSDELIYAITLNPAYSLELSQTTGSIEEGKDADILIHSVENLKQLFYFVGMNSVKEVIIKGESY